MTKCLECEEYFTTFSRDKEVCPTCLIKEDDCVDWLLKEYGIKISKFWVGRSYDRSLDVYVNVVEPLLTQIKNKMERKDGKTLE